MSAIGFLVLLVLAIVLLMVLIMKVKLHPTFALFTAALVMGLVMGIWDEGFSLPEVLGMSDRIMAVSEGKVTGILDKEVANQENIITASAKWPICLA